MQSMPNIRFCFPHQRRRRGARRRPTSIVVVSTDSNRESGHGRYDLYLPDRQNSRAAVLEFKRASSNSENQLEAGVRAALKQIEEKRYDARARKEGYKRILRAGIAFCGKSVKVGFEEVYDRADSPAP